MRVSARAQTAIRVDEQPIELIDELCYLGCMLKNNGSYEEDIQQICAKATAAFNSLTKCRPPSLTKSSCDSAYPHHNVRIEDLGNTINCGDEEA
ncbi:hypothetical protein RB195_022267 [Necator americanus]|uniref:Uncharacterized protein n=1 Tax=Necator americanus TaxID=51031 RepID=A0ABR1EFA3_NECAM